MRIEAGDAKTKKHLFRVFVNGAEEKYIFAADTSLNTAWTWERDRAGRFLVVNGELVPKMLTGPVKLQKVKRA